jgi:DNA polymerase-3 subunit delta'
MNPALPLAPGVHAELDLYWLAPQLQSLRRARAQGRMPHALLIQDAPGAGGAQLALLAAQTALCTEPAAPCGRCRECLRVAARTHPDLWFLAPEEDSIQIKVEQVRTLTDALALTGHDAAASVAIIDPADMLTPSSANALLKTLEEPRPGVLIVLVAQVTARLPATVLSRCQRLQVRAPPRAGCVAWLRERRGEGEWEAALDVLGNAPLRALTADPAQLRALRDETESHLAGALSGSLEIAPAAERWAQRDSFELRLLCAENWVTRRIAAQTAGPGSLTELHTGAHLPAAVSSMNIRGLIRLMDALYELRRLATTTINKSLAVEQLLWQLRAVRKS